MKSKRRHTRLVGIIHRSTWAAWAVLSAVALLLLEARAAETPRTAEGFAVPVPGKVFEFPRDHGSHPDFKIEWWYITGHLFSTEAPSRRFGFQATFFRQAGPKTTQADLVPEFGTRQLYLAHMALVDVQSGRFLQQERLNRNGWDADSSVNSLDVRNGDWSLRLAESNDRSTMPTLSLTGGIHADATFSLMLKATKPLVLFGENGVSKKGSGETAASHYLTFTRLATEGDLVLNEKGASQTLRVTGDAWMDHEISSSQLGEGQVGWDWVSIHFEDKRELMLYRLRLRDGTADPASSLTWVDAAGGTKKRPFSWEVLKRWKSPNTGASYPSLIKVATTDPTSGTNVEFTVEPFVANQELTGSVGGIPYWEGACRVRDASGREVGSAYMELTGYASDLKL